MTTRQAIKRLGWRFSEAAKRTDRSFKINKMDIDSLKVIADYYESESKRQIIDNQLFGKLYIFLYGEFVTYFQTSVLDPVPQKELNKILDKPIKNIVTEVMIKLNLAEIENVVKKDGSIKNYSPMEYKEVAENFRIMINSALNEFSVKKIK